MKRDINARIEFSVEVFNILKDMLIDADVKSISEDMIEEHIETLWKIHIGEWENKVYRKSRWDETYEEMYVEKYTQS